MLSNNQEKAIKAIINPSAGKSAEDYFVNLLALVARNREILNLEDSLSESELKAVTALTHAIESQQLVNADSTVIIWGCWYGSILIPYFSQRAKRVIGIDKDDEVIKFAKNKLFRGMDNVDLITDDVFATHRDFYLTANLIINPSCEHMLSMKDWHWFKHGALASDPNYPRGAADKDPSKKRIFKSPKLASQCYFAFQSSNKPGTLNGVSSIEEFKQQLPARAHVDFEDETPIESDIKYTLVGKLT